MEITDLEKERIIEALKKTKNKLSPCPKSLNYLVELFKTHVDANFSIKCARCRRNLTSFWSSQSGTWK